MSGEFAPVTGIKWTGQGVGMAEFGDDSKQLTFFFWKSVRNEAKSISENKPIFEDIAYIRIQPPGERLNIVERPAKEEDKYRFPRQWNLFVKKQAQVPEGSPIDLLYPNHPAYADMLRGYGIYTIQQLANLSANAIDGVGMGAQEAVNKAQRWLKESGDSAALNKLRVEVEEKDKTIRRLQSQLNAQKKQIDTLFERIGAMGPTTNELNIHDNPLDPKFDAQLSRINANHPTKEAKKGRKGSKIVEPDLSSALTPKITLEEVEETYE